MIQLRCTTCHTEKPVDAFSRNKRRASGRDGVCKSCTSIRCAAHYKKNKALRAAQGAAWRARNPGKTAEYCAKWKKNNPEKMAAALRAHYVKNREKLLADDKARREANYEKFIERERSSYAKHAAARAARMKRWSAANKSKIAKYAADKRAAKRTRMPPWLTDEHFSAILTHYEAARRAEVDTGIEHHVDHIVPLRGKTVSGLHVPWNMQVLPAKSNLRKSNVVWPDMP